MQMMRRMRRMSGKMKTKHDFYELFSKQVEFQQSLLKKKGEEVILPIDSVDWFSYHMQAMTEELGEVLKADKRWKTHRNSRYEREEKLDELADVFITAMNLCIYSDFDYEDISEAISKKIEENIKRLELKGGKQSE